MKLSALLPIVLCLSTPAWGQGVTLADLRDSVINVSAVHQEKIVRNGQSMSIELHTTGQVSVSAGRTISSRFQSIATNQSTGRSRAGPATAGTFSLDAPRRASQSYDVVWTFTNSSLVRLRVFSGGAGGQKMTIRFRRNGNAISCSFAMPLAREVGVGRIQKGSEIDRAPIDILEFRHIQSSCQVLRN